MIIYKKDSKGKIRFLDIYSEGNKLIQISGLLDTDSPIKRETVRKGKNIGRSNETTPEEQAELEAEAKVEAKLKGQYFKTIEQANNSAIVLPMLAKPYDRKRVEYPCWGQPKLDGMRGLGGTDGTLVSRKNRDIVTLDHIKKELAKVHLTGQTAYFDGELYAHGLNFQENMRLLKKYRPGETEKVIFHVYDLITADPFQIRYEKLKLLAANNPIFEVVETVRLNDEAEMHQYHAKNLAEGYEGTMVRWGQEGYAINKRSFNLMKYKQMQDITLDLLDVVPGDANPLHGYPVFRWSGAKGHQLGDDILGSGIKFSHKEREEFLINKDKYIGKPCELRFFEYSEEGVPRFPVMHGFRED